MLGCKLNSFKSKIILPITVILVMLTAALTVYTSTRFLSHCNDMISDKNNSDAKALQTYLKNCETFSKAAAVAMTYKPNLIKYVVNRDREALLQYLLPMLEQYHINFITITDENGNVILRTYQPKSYGDDISFQHNIQGAMRGEITTAFESGTYIRVSVRTGAPLYDRNGKFIGVVSAGVRFDTNELVDGLKDVFKSEVTIFEGDTRISTTIVKDGNRVEGTKIPPAVAKSVIEERNIFSNEIELFGDTYKAIYVPLINPADSVFATFFIGAPMDEHMTETIETVVSIVIISVIGLIAAILILNVVATMLSKPLIALANNIDRVERGDFSINIDVKGNDEIAHANRSLQKMILTMREFINSSNMAISECNDGKEHSIDIDRFGGECKLLAERIIKQSEFCVKDKLTGLANRRMFDARLELEWNRSLRDGQMLSLLMIDIDRFKMYNDEHGHRQGDAALETVAKVLTRSIKRGVDLAARWGGEEFAVLLPNTDSNGAMTVASKIRAAVEQTEIRSINDGVPQSVTVSIGVHTILPTADAPICELMSNADAALYRAKREGRNRVCQA